MILRTLSLEEPEKRRAPRSCEASGCGRSTRERKPFCPDHVEQHAYVQEVLGKLAAREAADERVLRRGPKAVDPRSLTAEELLTFLHVHGSNSVKRLARELNLEVELVDRYAAGLARLGLVSLGETRRRAVLVTLNEGAYAGLSAAPAAAAAPIEGQLEGERQAA